MKITNVRAGFATNSSSSHSIVMVPGGQHVGTDEYQRWLYGWEQFTLADPDSKAAYFVTQLVSALEQGDLTRGEVIHTVNSLLGIDLNESEIPADSYVDHQSAWYGLSETLKHNPRLLRDMYHFIQQPGIVILGGNDNSDAQEPPDNSWQDGRTEIFSSLNGQRVRQDADHWVLFDRRNGTKVRFSFAPDAGDYTKSSVPELVDIKLTDHCKYGCAFCYQGSTASGQHSSFESVQKILTGLGELGVFEVAFGGGEPTHYPHLRESLELCAQLDIVPNFTTFGVDWLRDPALVKATQAYVGAIGVSVHTVKDLSKVAKIDTVINDRGNNRWPDRVVRVVAQHVVGSVDISDTALLMEESWSQGVDLLLLGYKTTGFGANVEPHNMEGLDTLLRLRQSKRPHYNARTSMLGVDTAFVQQFEPILREVGVSNALITNEEGKFSMYIDAVTGSQGPSSYMPAEMQQLDLDDCTNSIKQAYKEW